MRCREPRNARASSRQDRRRGVRHGRPRRVARPLAAPTSSAELPALFTTVSDLHGLVTSDSRTLGSRSGPIKLENFPTFSVRSAFGYRPSSIPSESSTTIPWESPIAISRLRRFTRWHFRPRWQVSAPERSVGLTRCITCSSRTNGSLAAWRGPSSPSWPAYETPQPSKRACTTRYLRPESVGISWPESDSASPGPRP